MTAQNESNSTPGVSPKTKSAFLWYGLGISLLGGAVGFFAGSSNSPVVATLLPLLFGLIGGAGGFYLAQLNFSKEDEIDRLRIIGKCLSAFIVMVMLGSMYGIAVRAERSILDFFSLNFQAKDASNLDGLQDMPVEHAMELVLLRNSLNALDASAEEQKIIIGNAEKSLKSVYDSATIVSTLRGLSDLAQNVQKQITEDIVPDTKQWEEQHRDMWGFSMNPVEAVTILGRILDDLNYQNLYLAERIEAGEPVPLTYLQERNKDLSKRLGELIVNNGAATWLLAHKELRESVWNLHLTMIKADANLGSCGWTRDSRLSEKTNEYLKIVYGASPEEPKEPYRSSLGMRH